MFVFYEHLGKLEEDEKKVQELQMLSAEKEQSLNIWRLVHKKQIQEMNAEIEKREKAVKGLEGKIL